MPYIALTLKIPLSNTYLLYVEVYCPIHLKLPSRNCAIDFKLS